MKLFTFLLVMIVVVPPVAAVYVLIKRLKDDKFINQSDARERLFESICLENLQTRKNQKPLSEDNSDNKKNDNNIPVDLIKHDVPEDNKKVVSEHEEVPLPDTPHADPIENQHQNKIPAPPKDTDSKNQNSINKNEAADLVLNMMKQSKENGSPEADLKDMIELLKTGKK